MKKFIDIIISFFQLTFKIILAPKSRVLFYYPQHFNRSSEGTNPFFDPLLETCEKHKIKYKLIEEPDWGTDKPRNKKAIKGDYLFVIIYILRKTIKTIYNTNDFFQNEKITAVYLNFISFGKLKFPKYVSISGSMAPCFLALNRQAGVFEVQHGIIYSNTETYFNNGKLHNVYRDERWNLLLYGEGFRNCVIRGYEDELANRVHIIGCPLSLTNCDKRTEQIKAVLFSLQFVPDCQPNELNWLKYLLLDSLQQLSECGVKVLLKNHPRYNNCISLDDIYSRFNFVEETHASLLELQAKIFLHVTLDSTTAFEYAAVGIPTYFMHNGTNFLLQSIFYDDYKYPLFNNVSIQQVVEYLSSQDNYQQASAIVKKWYLHFYSPYNEKKIIELLDDNV